MKRENIVKLHRIMRVQDDVLYRAFIDRAAMCKWLPPYGFTAEVHECDPRVGGIYRMSFTNFRTNQSHAFGGRYLELTPHKRISYTDKFEDPGMPDEMITTITLFPVSCGTALSIVQENVPSQIPIEQCYLGWQESLKQLACLVESDKS